MEMYDTMTDNRPETPVESLARKATELVCRPWLGDLNRAAVAIHELNDRFYRDLASGQRFERNRAELIALMHSELSEMLEGIRKDENDKHLPHRKSEEVEAADVLIRLLDYCGYRKLDIAGALVEKLSYNATRADHANESRRTIGGKKF